MRSAERAVLAVAAALAFLATVMLAVRTGDSAPIPRTEVLGARVTHETPTPAQNSDSNESKSAKSPSAQVVVVTTSTTLTLETLPAAPPVTSSSGTTPTTAAGTPPTSTSTTVVRATTTTTPPPRDVTEQSDNTAEYKWTKDGSGGSSTTPDTQPPSDPLTFLVSAQWDAQAAQAGHDNVARLNAKLDNNTDKAITFPDGFVLRFLIDRDLKDGKGSQPWRTVEVKRDDIQTLPAHAEIVVVGQVFMDEGAYGTYDVGGEINVRYS
ncbi:MAG: hypothetical protein JOZ37_01265 [Actinobacteria bacterium]|nr:hypothetical protein [Actinomycetota bacterium]MBV8957321.1 hypothetical protein [Actinomycetota bacterium]MBV9256334.1 hypothetical protein [Actinomycetota bacterium]MBV9662564.1 hypothetical protein [Actinomycetota bacterium]MBV9935492.1 hypothetical protein [Actinomycetota bacterium]